MKATGKIIVLAYPDTFVKMSSEFICKLLPLVGIGTKEYIKAGHAALVLVNTSTGIPEYYDFGRYVTPYGFGRVRSAETDAELKIPFTLSFCNDRIVNLGDLLVWLANNSDKTHGEGRLLASVCDTVDYNKAKQFILGLQNQVTIAYSAFKKGSNCARFVADTLINASTDNLVKKKLRFNKQFTPSTVGNVEKAATNKIIYEVINGKIGFFKGTALKENLVNFFDTKVQKKQKNEGVHPPIENAQLLTGIGSNAWFLLSEEKSLTENLYRIRRYNDNGKLDFDGVFKNEAFNPTKPYRFIYNSNCKFCTILQDEKQLLFTFIESFKIASLTQKECLI